MIAQIFGVVLISPDDKLLSQLSTEWTKRNIQVQTLHNVSISFPIFIKPVIPKQFKASVYQNLEELLTETEGLSADTQLLISDSIGIEAEARGFVLHNKLKDLALYEGVASLEKARNFINTFLDAHPALPKTLVIDLGYNKTKGWFILEFNASWGAGLNNCDPEKVIECIISATINAE